MTLKKFHSFWLILLYKKKQKNEKSIKYSNHWGNLCCPTWFIYQAGGGPGLPCSPFCFCCLSFSAFIIASKFFNGSCASFSFPSSLFGPRGVLIVVAETPLPRGVLLFGDALFPILTSSISVWIINSISYTALCSFTLFNLFVVPLSKFSL